MAQHELPPSAHRSVHMISHSSLLSSTYGDSLRHDRVAIEAQMGDVPCRTVLPAYPAP